MNLVIPGRGASPASPEPKNAGKINQWLGLYAWVPGPAPTGRPGMTRGFFSSLLVLRRRQTIHSTVLAGLGPAIHETRHKPYRFSWMPRTRPGKTIWVRVNHLSASEH